MAGGALERQRGGKEQRRCTGRRRPRRSGEALSWNKRARVRTRHGELTKTRGKAGGGRSTTNGGEEASAGVEEGGEDSAIHAVQRRNKDGGIIPHALEHEVTGSDRGEAHRSGESTVGRGGQTRSASAFLWWNLPTEGRHLVLVDVLVDVLAPMAKP